MCARKWKSFNKTLILHQNYSVKELQYLVIHQAFKKFNSGEPTESSLALIINK